jgi:Tfp pilus assembly protein PilX
MTNLNAPLPYGRGSERRRGYAIIMVMFLLAVLSSFVVCATMLLRPAGQLLDMQLAFDQAQCAADGALEQALANLEAGKPLAVENLGDSKGQGRAEGKLQDGRAEITATGRAPALAFESGKASWAVVQLRVTAAKGKSGMWQVKGYVARQERAEDGGGAGR